MRPPLVFLDGPYRPATGLRSLALADWLWLDEDFAAETALRRRLSAERPAEVHAMLPEALPAARELLGLLIDWLPAHAPDRYRAEAGGLVRIDDGSRTDPDAAAPLLAAGLLVQEDLCLLGPDPGQGFPLLAAHLCFPAHWRLHEKLGEPMRAIHAPVPVFSDRLAGPVERIFGTLDPSRPVWRANWSVVESPELFHPQGRRPDPGLTAENAGARLWLRVERQTLRRLPETGFVLFTIRSFVRRLQDLVRMPGVAGALGARLRELPEEVARYKGLPAMAGPLLAWLDAVAAREAAGAGGVGPAPQHAPLG